MKLVGNDKTDTIPNDKRPYAVKVVIAPGTVTEAELADKIELAMVELSQRAMNAQMVLLNITLHSFSAPPLTAGSPGLIYFIVSAQWMSRAAVESMQAQQRLLGGVQPGKGFQA